MCSLYRVNAVKMEQTRRRILQDYCAELLLDDVVVVADDPSGATEVEVEVVD